MTAGSSPRGLPPGLRDRVLAAARDARAAGRPVPEPPTITPVEAYRRTVVAFDQLLGLLDDAEWHRGALRGLDAQGLVGHLIGVEDDMRRALRGDPAVSDVDHVEGTRTAAQAQAGVSPTATHGAWRAAADATLALLDAGTDLNRVVAVHGMRLPLGALLVARTFELWTHENDIRTATGLPPSRPDPSTLALMTDLAATLLPHGDARVGGGEPVALHLVLTGEGGGTWDIAIGDRGRSAGDVSEVVPEVVPEIMIVADALGFCRLVANRIGPRELAPHQSGAVAHAPRILAGAAALALD